MTEELTVGGFGGNTELPPFGMESKEEWPSCVTGIKDN